MSPETFNNRGNQIVASAYGALIVLIGLSGLITGHPAEGAGFLIFGAAFAVRAIRSSNVVVREDVIETRSMLRTRHFATAALSGADVAVGRVGVVLYRREYLLLRCKDGHEVPFKELNAKPGPRTVVREAVEAINQRVGGGEAR